MGKLKLTSGKRTNKKLLLIFVFFPFFLSCQSSTDLLSLKFDNDISKLVMGNKQLKEERDSYFGLQGYLDNEPDNYAIGEIKLHSYTLPPTDFINNNLLFYTDEKTNYLGFRYSSVNREETEMIIAYLKKKYPKFIKVEGRGSGESFLWDVPAIGACIILYQKRLENQQSKKIFDTKFIVLKRGIRMANRKDTSTVTIYDYYAEMMDSELLK
jgi:hypothetical protein